MDLKKINLKKFFNGTALQKALAFIGLLVIFIIFSFMSSNFLTGSNMITILLSSASMGIMAVGVTFVIITSGIDLSIGLIPTFSAVIFGTFLQVFHLPMWLALLGGVAAGALCGAITGTLISKFKLPPFIASLGVMMAARGLSLIISGVKPIYFDKTDPYQDAFTKFATGSVLEPLGLPIPNFVLIFFLVAIVASFLLSKTKFGRYTYAIGSNEEATRLSGVNTAKWKIIVYTFSGFLCAISGILVASRLTSVQPQQGVGEELNAIAAAVIGGTSLSGGEGSILGTIIGTLLMNVLLNGLRMNNVPQEWQYVFTGIIVIGAVLADIARRKKGNA